MIGKFVFFGKLKDLFRFATEDDLGELVKHFPNSLEVNRTQKGYTWSIKLRFNKGEEGATIKEINHIDQRLKDQYGDNRW